MTHKKLKSPKKPPRRRYQAPPRHHRHLAQEQAALYVALMADPGDELLTLGEVARSLRVSRSTVYKLIVSGHLRYVDLRLAGKRLPRVRRSDLDALVDARASGDKN